MATDETATITENEEKSSRSQEKYKKEVTEYAEQPTESENKERPRRFTSEEIENGRKHMPKSTIITKNALTVPKMDNESKESHDLP